MAKSLSLHLLLHLRRPTPMQTYSTTPLRLLSARPKPLNHASSKLLSTTATPYPLQYEMIVTRPAADIPRKQPIRRRSPAALPIPQAGDSGPDPDTGFEAWVDQRLSSKGTESDSSSKTEPVVMDKAKRRYYNKRRKRMYGESDSDEESGRRGKSGGDFIELKQEVVELHSVHKREEELYFHDAFAYPWEKNKHYKMVYQLEKKYFPDQCFDNAFLDPGKPNQKQGRRKKEEAKKEVGGEDMKAAGEDDRGLVFFEESEKEKKELRVEDVTEKKVEDFFKCLKKFPNESGGDAAEAADPFLSTRKVGLPPKWDGPYGTVVLVNKPKGWTSFTVCGKLRRLVKVKKVGHAGTLDPMATGLLIVCVGKATKVVDRYQGMIKGYSGIFRLGEATSTWDADSPVIQREPWEDIKDADIKKAAASFRGEIWQVPPMFSAIKVGGERMYEKARKGESIELSPRRISIFNFDVERSLDDRQNVIFRVTCSKGTYVRSLCADFGKALGSCAHLTALRRDSIGEYSADDAWEFQELEEEITKGYM
ncbi:Pseudouridine synthase family protein [Striga hermonthica]|uniref:tRNA pseudouridine(55) synthase n=1 Tax=Striga hermonthica TaxID=68872 RepID=A0A9N7RB84_STRHE|nr:Pseudouridine synthase family protein [Striga hermonthica]